VGDERNDARYGERWVTSGRKLLRVQGVLPWERWPDGAVPSEWWETDVFLGGIVLWRTEAMLRGVTHAALGAARPRMSRL
jgi:hypothetical protein